MPNSWTCTIIDASTTQCDVTASSTMPVGVPYGDWLVVNGIIVFCLGFVVIRAVVSLFSFK